MTNTYAESMIFVWLLKDGIKCFSDGDITNTDNSNCYYLDICDILNVMVKKRKGLVPKLFVSSISLKTIEPEMKNLFTDSLLTAEQCAFVVDNADILYLMYGYYGNFLFVPRIHTVISWKSQVFVESKFFTNDKHFCKDLCWLMLNFLFAI